MLRPLKVWSTFSRTVPFSFVSQDRVIHLRAELNSSRTEAEEVERDLTTTNNRVNRKTHELRGQLTQGQVAARKQLTNLTMQSDSAAKKLRAVVAKVSLPHPFSLLM